MHICLPYLLLSVSQKIKGKPHVPLLLLTYLRTFFLSYFFLLANIFAFLSSFFLPYLRALLAGLLSWFNPLALFLFALFFSFLFTFLSSFFLSYLSFLLPFLLVLLAHLLSISLVQSRSENIMSFICCFCTYAFTFLVIFFLLSIWFHPYCSFSLYFSYLLALGLTLFSCIWHLLTLPFLLGQVCLDSLSFFLSTSRSVFRLSIRILQYHHARRTIELSVIRFRKNPSRSLVGLDGWGFEADTFRCPFGRDGSEIRHQYFNFCRCKDTEIFFQSRLKNTFRFNFEFERTEWK